MDSSAFPDKNNSANCDEGIEVERDDVESPNRRSKRNENPRRAKKAKKKVVVPTRSPVWDHYTKDVENRNKCKCNYCGRTMCCATTSGTSSLTKHLRACKSHQVWQETQSQNQHVLNVEGDDGSGTIALAKVDESVIKEATNELIVLAELPLAFVECLGWRHFCNKIKLPKPVSRRTSTREIVKMFVNQKAHMRRLIKENKQRVSLTTDIWVAPTTASSYMVITSHFVDSSWRLRKLIIGFKNIPDHKGATICSVLLECLAEWGIDKVFTITVDNATANTSALKMFKAGFRLVGNEALVLDGEFMHMRCCAHILNLVVKDGLHELNNSVAAIRNAVHYVRASSTRVNSFGLRVETGKMTRGSLSLDCRTRWNSTHLMLTRALKFRLAFEKTLVEDKLYNDHFLEKVEGKKRIGPPSTEDWEGVERLVRFLVIFYNATLVVSASNSVGSYKCYNEIVTIERNLIHLSNNIDEELRKKAKSMRDKFDKYWEGVKEINRLLIVASVFDPRNKMKFATWCFDTLYGIDSAESKAMYASVMEVMKNLFVEYSNRVNVPMPSSQSAASTSYSEQESQEPLHETMELDTDHGYERMDHLYQEMVNEIGNANPSIELEIYLKEEVVNPKSNLLGLEYDVLNFWKVNSSKFPVLSEVARDVLAMQVSSVASESAFSTSGRVLSPSRSCLTHYMIEVLMCTEQWMKCDLHFTEKGLVTIQQLLGDIEMQDELEAKNTSILDE